MNNTVSMLDIERDFAVMARCATKRHAELFFKKPENMAAFEKWKVEREEAANADKQ